MLKVAQKVLDGTLDREVAKKARDEFWSELDDWEDTQEYKFEPQYVGYGSAKAVTAALNDVLFSEEPLHDGESDWHHDPWEWQTDIYCSLPYKGSRSRKWRACGVIGCGT